MRIVVFFFLMCFSFIPLTSCSTADNIIEEYEIEVEHIVKDTTSNNNSPHNDTTNNEPKANIIVVKDTIRLSYERYMGLIPSFGPEQGAACYGKYLIQGYTSNGWLGVYDLEKKYAICKLDVPAPATTPLTHANTVNFGFERLSPDDYFPLLYISSGYTQKINGVPCSFIYVYRICKYNNSEGEEDFHIEFVQTITLKGFNGWTDCITDNDHNMLWIKYVPYGSERRCASFPMPKLEEGDVTLLKDNATIDFSLGAQSVTSYNQGHLYHDNKILFVSGTDYVNQKLAFVVVDLTKQCYELVIDLAEIGLTREPENVFYYNEQLMIGFKNEIYKFNLFPENK